MISWGLIEVVGYTPAVVAADVMLKTADVKLAGIEIIGGGYVTVAVTGEIAAVKTAIDAGTEVARQVGEVHCSTVIAKPAKGAAAVTTIKLNEK